MRRPGQMGMSPAMRASIYHHHQRAHLAYQGARIIMPRRSVLAEVVEELRQAPPTDDELRLLTEVARQAEEQNLAPEQIEARLGDTRLWRLLRTLAAHRQDILSVAMLLLMIVQLFSDRHPPKEEPPPPPPAPQVSVTVVVPTDELVDEIVRRLKEEGCEEPDSGDEGGSP